MIKYNSKPIPISVTIYPEQLALLNCTGMDKSKLIRRSIDIAFIENGEIDRLISEKEADIELLRKLKGAAPELFPKLEANEFHRNFLSTARKIIERDPSFKEGQWKAFKNTFGSTPEL